MGHARRSEGVMALYAGGGCRTPKSSMVQYPTDGSPTGTVGFEAEIWSQVSIHCSTVLRAPGYSLALVLAVRISQQGKRLPQKQALCTYEST